MALNGLKTQIVTKAHYVGTPPEAFWRLGSRILYYSIA